MAGMASCTMVAITYGADALWVGRNDGTIDPARQTGTPLAPLALVTFIALAAGVAQHPIAQAEVCA